MDLRLQILQELRDAFEKEQVQIKSSSNVGGEKDKLEAANKWKKEMLSKYE